MKLTGHLCASTAIVALGAAVFMQPVAAQEIATSAFELPPVVSTASRLSAGLTSSSVTIVDREAIDRHPGQTLPEILATEAGLHVRDIFGSGNSSAVVDIRGFGEQATQNVLVLVDGRRINDLDLSGVQFALVSRSSIQRIEVLRGAAASVLYGEGAVGGAINIVTQGGPKKTGVSVTGTVGSFGYRRARGIFQWGGEQAHIALTADTTESDGYRRNNQLTRHIYSATISGDIGHTAYRLGATYNTEELGLPGNRIVNLPAGINLVESNPRGAQNPLDFAEERGVRFEAGIEQQLNDGLKLTVDTAYRRSLTSSDFIGAFTLDDRALSTASISPRISYNGEIGGHAVNFIGGIDASHTTAEVERRFIGFAGGADFDGWQSSVSVYGQADVALTDGLTLDTGVRAIRTGLMLESPQNPQARVRNNETDLAANLGLAFDVTDSVEVFVRGGRAVRVPTIDERVGTQVNPLTFLPVTFDLKTQTSWDMEAGTEFSVGPVDARVSIFEMNVRDQIAFTPGAITGFGFNTNLDKTRRRGIEAEAVADVGAGFSVTPRVNWLRAEFTEGPFNGNQVPVVPNLTAGLGVSWTGDNIWANANWRYVSDQRMINDQEQLFPEIPSYDLLDIAAGGTIGKVSISGELRNVLDESYFSSSVGSDTNANLYGAFPQPGRAFYLEASVDF